MSADKVQNKKMYSFSNMENDPLSDYSQKINRSPLAETDLLQLRQKYMGELSHQMSFPSQPPPFIDYPIPPPLPDTPKLTYNELLDQIGRLQEVICYLGADKQQLKEECSVLQEQIGVMKNTAQKEREGLQSQMRKLREQLREKEFECVNIGKIGAKEKEMLQQENERIKNHIKNLIEKKNDEMFALARESEVEYQKLKHNLQNKLSENKQNEERLVRQLNGKLQQKKEQIAVWKEKYRGLEQEMQRQDRRNEQIKLSLMEENEVNMGQLKQKYHRTKMLLIERSLEEVKVLEDGAELQKELFCHEVQELKDIVAVLERENTQLKNIGKVRGESWQKKLEENSLIIKELEGKLEGIHRRRKQEIELTKVKISQLHASDLALIEKVYSSRISVIEEKLVDREGQIRRLEGLLEHQLEKNSNLCKKMRQRDSQLHEQMAKMRIMHANAEQTLKLQFQTQKSLIMQQSAQSIKLIEAKAGNSAFKDQELKRLRSSLDEKVNQLHRMEEMIERERMELEEERKKLKKEMREKEEIWREEEEYLKKQLAQKTIKNQQLREEIKKTLILAEPDYNKYLSEIMELKAKIAKILNEEKEWEQKYHQLQQKARNLSEQKQKATFEANLIVNEAKSEWQALEHERINELQDFYRRKVSHLEMEREQLRAECEQAHIKSDDLARQCLQLQSLFQETTKALAKRTDFETRIIQLGSDINLIKNKQELFEF